MPRVWLTLAALLVVAAAVIARRSSFPAAAPSAGRAIEPRLTIAPDLSRGVTLLVAGHTPAAVSALRAAAAQSSDPDVWSDYAAALFVAAKEHDDTNALLDALAAADRAIELRPEHAAGRFNRALALHSLGLFGEARREWQRVAEADPASGGEALRRMHEVPLQTEAAERRDAFRRLDGPPLPRTEVRALVERLPQATRAYGESLCMCAWAASIERGDAKAAAERLAVGRTIGDELRAASGEALLAAAVVAADRARDPNELAAAYLLYCRGRQAHSAHRATAAEKDFRSAAELFAKNGSPMAFIARYYTGSALHAQLRLAESLALLDELAGEVPPDYRALRAQIGWERGLCLAAQGAPFAGIAVLTESRDRFAELRERGNQASLNTILADVHDFVGNGEAAWKARRLALADLERTGDTPRVIVALEGAAGRKVRIGEWTRAAALLDVVLAMAIRARDAYASAHTLSLRSIIDTELGQPNRAASVLARARDWAKSVSDERARRQIDADIAMADGYASRRGDPNAAVARFDDAFRWYSAADYRVPLPRVLLERGRAQRSLRRFDAAAADFDAAIGLMEELRRAIPDALQRAAAFSPAEEIFDEAVSLALERGEEERAFELSERGRARTLVDTYQRDQPLMRLRELQSALAEDAAIVEYALVRDAAVAFVVTRTELHVVPVRADRHSPELVLEPVRPLLKGKATLAIIPDRFLSSVAFGAIESGGRRLVDDHVIVQAPSANVAIIASRAARRSSPRPLAAVAASRPDPRRYPGLERLDAAEPEARSVAALYGDSEVLAGADATAARAAQAFARAGTIHFAGHALASSGHPLAARLVLSEGELTASDIAGMRLSNAPAVVLAACRTARSDESRDGASSLAVAFLIAGAPAVIGSALDLEDEAVAEVVVRLHHNLLRHGDAAVALQATLAEKPSDPRTASITAFGGSSRLIRQNERRER